MMPFIFLGLGVLSLGLFLFKRDKKSSVIAIALKSVTSMFFILTAIFAFIENASTKVNMDYTYTLGLMLLLIGLIFGMIGDIFLDFKIYFKTLNMRFLCLENDYDILMITGMSAFGIGHVCYIYSSYTFYPDLVLYLVYSMVGALLLTALIFFVSIKVMKMDFRKFLIPCIIYCFLLTTFVIFSIFRLAFDNSLPNILLLIGSILFIVSDLVLSITYFSKKEDYEKKGFMNPESKLMIVLNHTTYYAAQFLIALAILFL